MKKSKVLATTILAEALLFTGVSATHYANASENVTKSQAEESVKNFVTNNSDFNPYNDTKYAEWQTALKVTVNETSTNTAVATDNSISQENNTQSTQSNEAQALPETGEQSNSGLVTIVASVLLAAGSLLAFRRT